MIVVDTSALVAIIRHEGEEDIFTDLLDRSEAAIMSSVSFVEANMVLMERRLHPEARSVESALAALGIEVVDVTREQASLAVRGFLAYGKGRHRARLNLADCFAYALAKSRGAPLLFKGGDFLHTDVAAAWQEP